MDNAGYAALTRQVGLNREMRTVANNLANMSTSGYRAEGVVFTEFIRTLDEGRDSISMATARAGLTTEAQGALRSTGRLFDLAIEGPGFFRLATPDGDMLTRAGAFVRTPDGALQTPDGMTLLDAGGAPVFVPPDTADVAIAPDGTVSTNGVPLGAIGLWQAAAPEDLARREGVRFAVDAEPVALAEGEGRVMQGYLEASNVSPVAEITRMIEVQRAYELGQGFLDREDERMRAVIRTFGR